MRGCQREFMVTGPGKAVRRRERGSPHSHLADPIRYPLPSKSCNLTLYAYWAGVSLILRFLVRRPLRQRNIREMTLQRNLFKDHEGRWPIRFSGQELKVDRRDGGINCYVCEFLPDLVPLLEE